MKAFKKWLLADKAQILVGDFRAEVAWKDALKWVLDGFDELYDGEMENSHIAQRIKKELGE